MGAKTTMPAKEERGKAKDRLMRVVGKKYASVSELVRDTSDSEIADEFDQYQADRKLVNCLTVMRCAHHGVSQMELAERMGCNQSKVSKMETSADVDLNFGDVISYARSLKQSIRMTFSPERNNRADHIRFHIAAHQARIGPTRGDCGPRRGQRRRRRVLRAGDASGHGRAD